MGPQGPQGPGYISRSGSVNPDGTPQFAPNVTITHTGLGCYSLAFAAGTFTPGTVAVPVFMPVGGAAVTAFTSGSVAGNGSVTATVCFSSDSLFTYTVTGQP